MGIFCQDPLPARELARIEGHLDKNIDGKIPVIMRKYPKME
jgi:hypothetical protein